MTRTHRKHDKGHLKSSSREKDILIKPTTIRIKNISRNVSVAHLEEIFSTWGQLDTVRIPLDREVDIPLDYAILEYKNTDDAKRALKSMNGGQIDGKEVSISFVIKKSKVATSRGDKRRDRESARRRSSSRTRRRRIDELKSKVSSRRNRDDKRKRSKTSSRSLSATKRRTRDGKHEARPKYSKDMTRQRGYSSTSSSLE